MDLTKKKVAVVGLGMSNRALIRYLLAKGVVPTACDRLGPKELGGTYDQLAAQGVAFRLGPGYLEDLEGFDVVFLTPGMPKNLPQIEKAKEAGVVLSSETDLFFALCPAPIVGITGSSGKTTTTTLVGKLLAGGGGRVFVGGNIGTPLIDQVDSITNEDRVVLELSSFQLELMEQSPHVAVITNITPNHLDVHPTMEDYVHAKKNIYRWQHEGDVAIFNEDDPYTPEMIREARGQVFTFSRRRPVARGAWVDGEEIVLTGTGLEGAVCSVRDLALLGSHNVENVLAACLAAAALGAPLGHMAEVCRTFTGVAHRLELVGEVCGVKYYNDSIATTPARAIAGLNAFTSPIVLIAGGSDKNLPFDELADHIISKVRHLVLVGLTAEKIERAVRQKKKDFPILRAKEFSQAVRLAAEVARPGDVVLLSPACASYDMFRNFEERGDLFRRLVKELADETGTACSRR